MKLHYKKIGAKSGAGQPMIILHGMLGMLDNWLTPAKKLAEKYDVYLLDQRNHGHSPHHEDFNYQVMAEDLFQFVKEHQLSAILLMGHSMGGKTAMQFTLQHPGLVKKLIVVDMAPKAYPVKHKNILQGLSAVDFSKVKDRSDVDQILKEYIAEAGIRQFLMKSLYWKKKGKLAWRFNLDPIKRNIAKIGEKINDGSYEGDTLFIRGAKSDYILDSDMALIKSLFPNAFLVTIPDAGHWVHAEQPVALMECLAGFLDDL